jgi:hypothetical protein
MVKGLVAEGRAHLERLDLEAEMRGEILAQGLPVLHLPALPDGIEGGGLAILAEALEGQGVA